MDVCGPCGWRTLSLSKEKCWFWGASPVPPLMVVASLWAQWWLCWGFALTPVFSCGMEMFLRAPTVGG